MKKLFVGLFIGAILLMTFGIVFAQGMEDSIKENLEKKFGKNVENITEVGEGFYEVDVGEDKPVFVITFGGEPVQETSSSEKIYSTRTFLNFGFAGEMSESGFLKTSVGIETATNKGYVMMRKGSITGISTNLNVIKKINSGKIEIIIYKNDELIGLGNVLNAGSSGMKKDYDLQSENVVVFEPGDVISIYAEFSEGVSFKDAITIIEITTLN